MTAGEPAHCPDPSRFDQGHRTGAPHLAVLIPSLRGGGAERVVVNLLEGFVNHELRIDLLLVREGGSLRSEVPSRVRVRKLSGGRTLAAMPSLVSYLRQERPDALLAHLAWVNLVALWASAVARTGTRIVVTAHNTYSQVSGRGKSWKHRLLVPLSRWFYPRADAVVGVSAGVVEDLVTNVGIPGSITRVIYNPVASERLLEAGDTVGHRQDAGEQGERIVLGAGRLSRQKNFSLLIRAFRRVVDEVDAELVILGEGDERGRLEALVEELGLESVVRLPGYVEDPTPRFREAAVFVLSSDWEGLPTVLIEALAFGCPVVSTRCPSGPEEILEGGSYGSLVPPGDDAALADAILATLRDPPAREHLRRRARDFTVDRAVAAYLDVLFPGRFE